MEDQYIAPTQPYHLVVIHPFGVHQRGAVISDPDDVADVLAGENAHHVNKIKAQ